MQNLEEKIEDVDKLIKNFFKSKNIDLENYKLNEKDKKETYCKVCGEIISFVSDEGYETGRDCRCMRKYRLVARLNKFKKYSVTVRNENKDTFSNVDRSILSPKEIEIFRMAHGYTKRFDENLKTGGGFLFQGTPGSGKTFLANCICNEIESKNFSVISLNLADYFKILRENLKEEDNFLKLIKEVDMLFIDDVGSEQINRKDGSNWAEEKIYNLFNTRNSVHKPLIITTNLTAKELENHLKFGNSNKIYSRLRQMLELIEMNFDDKRLKNKFKVLF